MNKSLFVYTLLASIGFIFFVFLSIPFNFFTNNAVGVESATIFAAGFYMLFASLLFLYLFRKLR
jgi:hypothetical protein